MASPYFESGNANIDEAKKGMLQAVAQGGEAGKQAFDQAQASAQAARQDAIARAQGRAYLGIGGDNQTFLGAADARVNQMGVNRANFESGLAQTGASNASYLEKARSSIPTLEAINLNKKQSQEAVIKSALELAEKKAQEQRDKESRADQRARDREDRADTRANTREDRADARAAAREASKMPTANQLLGQGQSLADMVNKGLHAGANAKPGDADAMGDVDNAVFTANNLFNGVGTNGVSTVDAARSYAKSLGLDEGTVNGILTPQATGAWQKASAPTRDAYAKSLATKYAPKGISYDLAKSAVNGDDFNESVSWILNGADGMTRDEAAQKLRDFYLKGIGRRGGNPGPWTAEYEILMGEYVPALPAE